MKEQVVVDYVEKCLAYEDRYFVNVHGNRMTANGTPDIITCDSSGKLLCIEVKAPNQSPEATQWLRAIEVVYSGGRYVIAQDDFDLDLIDSYSDEVPKISVINNRIEAPIKYAKEIKIKQTTEIVTE